MITKLFSLILLLLSLSLFSPAQSKADIKAKKKITKLKDYKIFVKKEFSKEELKEIRVTKLSAVGSDAEGKITRSFHVAKGDEPDQFIVLYYPSEGKFIDIIRLTTKER